MQPDPETVVVPREPTPEMIYDGALAIHYGIRNDPRVWAASAYRAMLAAAPQPVAREEAQPGALVAQIDALLAIPDASLSHRIPGLARQLLERSATALRARSSEPVAWVIRAPNGFVRMWTPDESRAKSAAGEWGLEAKQEPLGPISTPQLSDALRVAREALAIADPRYGAMYRADEARARREGRGAWR